ncbi:hypothetical protein AVEN_200663-1 [Araneus ventricosus]|uniref:ZSWIM1/3 RNaseH-like domain-containing protein n=1 Tax=Araneus ventricosus TaxID=182803 RepID=A0A4Y2L6P9_ARAVE|nr:hypothetical protein AVEN_200663-1 [Araneus ventricosus]
MFSYFYGQQVVESSFEYHGEKIMSSKASTLHSPCLNAKSETSSIPDKQLYSSVLKKEVVINSVYSILKNTIDLEKPISKQRNGGGAISKLSLKCKAYRESSLSHDLYSKHVGTLNCSLMQHSSRKVVYPKKCDKCLNTYKTRASFSYHKHKCNEIKLPELQNYTTLYGPSDLDNLPTCQTSFALGFQTEYQRDMLVSNSDKILCIDSTHKTNQYDLYLINLIVPDKYGKGCAVAHFITDYLDVNVMICLFSNLKIKIPDLNVNCIMTDNDQNTFEAFNAVFGPSIRHLLRKWHVLRSWSRQLHAKVSDKQLVKEMNLRLSELLDIKEKDAFVKFLVEFENAYLSKSPGFVDYFKKHYCNRVQLWSASYRNFPRASTDTNNYFESFHNQLKTVYFQRKLNRHIDRLVRTVLDI